MSLWSAQPSSQWVPGFSPGVKPAGREALTSSSVEIKSTLIYTCSHPGRLHIAVRD